MRGDRERQANIMLAVTPETFVPEDHPLRRINRHGHGPLARRRNRRGHDCRRGRGRAPHPHRPDQHHRRRARRALRGRLFRR